MGYTNTILIVDDADFVRATLSFMLEKAGYSTLSGADGRDALALLDGREIDLLITDLHMPGMDGKELIAAVREDKYYQYTPIVLFVADDADDREHFSSMPEVTMVFDKNNIKDRLLPAVRKLIGNGTL